MNEILLVEDSPNDAALLVAVLKERTPTPKLHVARNGVEALDFLFYRGEFGTRRTGNPCVVLLDLKLPGMDGFEVLRQIRAEPRLKFIPVVVFTSSAESGDLKKSYSLGANAYVVKPIDYQELLDVARALGSFWTTWNEPPPEQSQQEKSAPVAVGAIAP